MVHHLTPYSACAGGFRGLVCLKRSKKRRIAPRLSGQHAWSLCLRIVKTSENLICVSRTVHVLSCFTLLTGYLQPALQPTNTQSPFLFCFFLNCCFRFIQFQIHSRRWHHSLCLFIGINPQIHIQLTGWKAFLNNWIQHTKYFWGGSFLCLLFLISIFFWLSFNFWPQGVLCRFDWRSSNNHRNLVWKSFFRWWIFRNDNLWKTKKFKFVNLSVICSWRRGCHQWDYRRASRYKPQKNVSGTETKLSALNLPFNYFFLFCFSQTSPHCW